MPVLHFNTDVGRDVVNSINTCANQTRSELNTMRNKVSNLTGSEWQGNASVEFQQEVQTWSQRLETTLTTLETIRQKLDREIQEWEAAAQSFP
jgi:WXG100 family type VII secretion target